MFPEIGGFPPKMDGNPIKMDDLGVPIFLETPMCMKLVAKAIYMQICVPISGILEEWKWGCPLHFDGHTQLEQRSKPLSNSI